MQWSGLLVMIQMMKKYVMEYKAMNNLLRILLIFVVLRCVFVSINNIKIIIWNVQVQWFFVLSDEDIFPRLCGWILIALQFFISSEWCEKFSFVKIHLFSLTLFRCLMFSYSPYLIWLVGWLVVSFTAS